MSMLFTPSVCCPQVAKKQNKTKNSYCRFQHIQFTYMIVDREQQQIHALESLEQEEICDISA